jgi:allophanate hydrolase subunit 2
MIEVVEPGPLTTVQDRGRPGLAHLGVPPSGAVDARALALGNVLVGNPPGAAGLEATLLGPRLRFDRPTLVALTGACEPRVLEVAELDAVPCVDGARL